MKRNDDKCSPVDMLQLKRWQDKFVEIKLSTREHLSSFHVCRATEKSESLKPIHNYYAC